MRFHETQRFRRPRLWIVVLVCLVAPIAARACRARPTSDREFMFSLAIVLATGLALVAPFKLARLEVTVTDREVVIRFHLFHWKERRIALSEIAEAHVRKYKPIAEYGGRGIRYGFSGVAYNVAGDEGVQLVLTNGKRILIGSQRSRELEAAITSRM